MYACHELQMITLIPFGTLITDRTQITVRTNVLMLSVGL
jgi:uncharacterized membrane protein YccF (DUF307 family)